MSFCEKSSKRHDECFGSYIKLASETEFWNEVRHIHLLAKDKLWWFGILDALRQTSRL